MVQGRNHKLTTPASSRLHPTCIQLHRQWQKFALNSKFSPKKELNSIRNSARTHFWHLQKPRKYFQSKKLRCKNICKILQYDITKRAREFFLSEVTTSGSVRGYVLLATKTEGDKGTSINDVTICLYYNRELWGSREVV